MHRSRWRDLVKQAGVVGLVGLMAGCAVPQPSPRLVDVTLYGRNAALAMAWFATRPLTEPISSVGFGADLGYACWQVPEGSSVGLLDHAPSDTNPASVVREVATIEAPASGPVILWVEVAADGRVTSGAGMPAWWPHNGGQC